MADFATEFITKLNGKLTPEQMKVVLNELEIFSDDYNIEKKCRDVAVPDDLLPACYKVYMVSKKIEGMSPQSLITYKCYLEQFLYAVGKPVEKITANDIRLYLYGLVGKNSDHTIDTKCIVINTFLDWCCLEYYIPENPCAKIHAIKYEEKPREPLDGIGRPLFPHLIRHTTATNAIDHGMDVTDLQKLLGHTRISTTMIYAKVTQENVRYSHHRYVV